MATSTSQEIHLLDYWHVLKRRKFLCALTVLLILLLTALITAFTPPLYQAASKLEINRPQQRLLVFPDSAGFSRYQQNYLATQIEVIKSLPVVEKAVQSLYPDADDVRHKALEVMPLIKVTPIGFTDMVWLAVQHGNPDTAVSLANSLAETFEKENEVERARRAKEAYEQLARQLTEYKRRLDDAQNKLSHFIAETGMVKMAGYRDVDLEKMGEYQDRYLSTVMKITELELTLQQLKRVSNDLNYASSVSILKDNQLLQSLYTQLVDKEMLLKKLSRQYKESYPQVVELKADIQDTRIKMNDEIARILTSVEAELEGERKKESQLKDIVEENKEKALALGEVQQEYVALEQQVNEYKDVYEIMKKRMEEMEIAEELRDDNVSVREPAIRAVQIRPKVAVNAVCGVGAAFILALSVAFIAEYMDKSVRTFSQIKDKLGLQVLGVVPSMGNSSDNNSSGSFPRVIPVHSSRTPGAEAYRSLRTSLQFLQGKERGQTLLVTSPVAGEGKSTTVANLSIVTAQSGLQVLLVDTDLRRPSIHKCFGLRNTQGLTTVLSGKDSLDNVIKSSSLGNLSVLCSGPLPPNPSELLASEGMNRLLGQIKEKYDFIFFDSPPTIAVTDASILAQELDGVVLVIRGGGTSVEAAQHATQILDQVNAQILGVVLNHVMPKEGAYYYYYYYRYYDSYYYGPSRPKGERPSSRGKGSRSST